MGWMTLIQNLTRKVAIWSEWIFANILGLVDLNTALPKADIKFTKVQITNVPPSGDDKKPMENISVQSLVSDFECPVCYDYAHTQIVQCHNGHIVCQTCRPKLTHCPTCRIQFGADIRNLFMEKVASKIMFPCRYHQLGCSASLVHTEKVVHEETCEFRSYSCPYAGGCRWQGALEQVMSHLMQVHEFSRINDEETELLVTDINRLDAADCNMILSCIGHHFMFILEKEPMLVGGNQHFLAIVQLIGTRKQAENFKYTFKLKGYRGRMSWEPFEDTEPMPITSICESISPATADVFFLIAGNDLARKFDFNVTISRC